MTTTPSTEDWSRRVRSLFEGAPGDLLLVGAVTALAVPFLTGAGTGYSRAHVILGLGFVLVFPGYALVSALFPARANGKRYRPVRGTAYSPDTDERIVLSFLCSLALLPPLALAHSLLGRPFERAALLGSVTALVLVLTAVAAVRRLSLSPADRYSSPSVSAAASRVHNWIGAGGTADTALSLALTVAVLLAVGNVALGVTGPSADQSYTSVSLVTPGPGGEFVASNYPTNLTAGEDRALTLRVENRHATAAEYTTAVELQRVEGRESDSLEVVERERLRTFRTRIGANDTWSRTHTVAPTTTGSDLRLVYYVYRGEAPATPSVDDADATVHLWVTVQ